MGELHLEILVDRMLREFKVEANIGAPQVLIEKQLDQVPRVKENMQDKQEVKDNMDT